MLSSLSTPSRRRWLAALAPIPALFAACSSRKGPGPQLDVSFHVPGEPAPRSLSDFRGRLVALTLWTPGCSDCDQQAATLDALAKQFSADGLVCFALHDRSQEFTVVGLSILHGALDPSQASTLPTARPTTLLLDREGRIRAQFERFRDAEDLAGDIQPLIAR